MFVGIKSQEADAAPRMSKKVPAYQILKHSDPIGLNDSTLYRLQRILGTNEVPKAPWLLLQ